MNFVPALEKLHEHRIVAASPPQIQQHIEAMGWLRELDNFPSKDNGPCLKVPSFSRGDRAVEPSIGDDLLADAAVDVGEESVSRPQHPLGWTEPFGGEEHPHRSIIGEVQDDTETAISCFLNIAPQNPPLSGTVGKGDAIGVRDDGSQRQMDAGERSQQQEDGCARITQGRRVYEGAGADRVNHK